MGQSEAYLQPGKRRTQRKRKEEGTGMRRRDTKKRALGVKHPRQFQDTPCRYPGVLAAQVPFSSSSSSSMYSCSCTDVLSFYLSLFLVLCSFIPSLSFLFIARPYRSLFSLHSVDIPFLVPFSIGFLFCRTATFVTLFLLLGILRAGSLRLFSLVPSASRLLYEVIMYRIRYHLIAILRIEKSLVVTVSNTIYFRCENFHFFF